MSITYTTIINSLVEEDEEKTEIIDLLLTNKNDFSTISNIVLDHNYSCYGILNYDDNNDNISIYSSILTLLDTNFILPFYKDELIIINNFKNNIINHTIINNIEFMDLSNNNKLQIISNILNINIIIFDKLDKDIFDICDNFNPYKTTILLSLYNSLYEPIINQSIFQRCFTFNDEIIKNILKYKNIKYNTTKENTNITNTNIYINIYIINVVVINKPNDVKIDDVKTDDLKTDDLKIDDAKTDKLKITKSKLNLMKLADLKILANKYKINIIDTNKNLLKKDIIDIIFNNLTK